MYICIHLTLRMCVSLTLLLSTIYVHSYTFLNVYTMISLYLHLVSQKLNLLLSVTFITANSKKKFLSVINRDISKHPSHCHSYPSLITFMPSVVLVSVSPSLLRKPRLSNDTDLSLTQYLLCLFCTNHSFTPFETV